MNSRHPNEKRSARLEFRAPPSLKADIHRAASLMGMEDTSYALSVLREHARSTIDSHERSHLSEADSKAFLAALDTPAEPTESLRGLFELHRSTRGDAD
ncbi:type II toxin-antitoxin system TacA family antitoxin [Spiribacter onubensis]|uniref:DUF1778 domain-containing protein n=1 Tax=Spiribacter onubensis TaxID=3122420 RepID=A0ABV3SB65_9GAMM